MITGIVIWYSGALFKERACQNISTNAEGVKKNGIENTLILRMVIILLTIEEYISRRKKEDNLDEFDIYAKTQNMKICVDYVFEYFNNYINITEAEDKTVLHREKLDKYRKQLADYDPEVRSWAVTMYDEYGKQIDRYIRNVLKENGLFFFYNTDNEFRNVSYECYNKLVKKLPFLKEHTEMFFLFIKDYHRVKSQLQFEAGIPFITDEITEWVEQTWIKNNVNLAAFSYNWINMFFDHDDIWPSTHRKKSDNSWRKFDYDYKQKSNLFNIDSLYRKIPKKSFIKGRKQELEILFMYYWIHDIEGDKEYWQEYLEKVLPDLKE